jgi:hypothetical protein
VKARLAQWAVGDISRGREVKDIQPHTIYHEGFLVIDEQKSRRGEGRTYASFLLVNPVL